MSTVSCRHTRQIDRSNQQSIADDSTAPSDGRLIRDDKVQAPIYAIDQTDDYPRNCLWWAPINCTGQFAWRGSGFSNLFRKIRAIELYTRGTVLRLGRVDPGLFTPSSGQKSGPQITQPCTPTSLRQHRQLKIDDIPRAR